MVVVPMKPRRGGGVGAKLTLKNAWGLPRWGGGPRGGLVTEWNIQRHGAGGEGIKREWQIPEPGFYMSTANNEPKEVGRGPHS